jgi:hypothetical protein
MKPCRVVSLVGFFIAWGFVVAVLALSRAGSHTGDLRSNPIKCGSGLAREGGVSDTP